MKHPAVGYWFCKSHGQWNGKAFIVVEPDKAWSGHLTENTPIIAYSDTGAEEQKSGMTWRGTFREFLQLFERAEEMMP